MTDRPDMAPLSAPGTPIVGLDPLGEPVDRVRPGMIAVLALTNLGIWTAFFTPIQFLLPLQVEGLTPGSKETSLSLVLTLGALVSLVVTRWLDPERILQLDRERDLAAAAAS